MTDWVIFFADFAVVCLDGLLDTTTRKCLLATQELVRFQFGECHEDLTPTKLDWLSKLVMKRNRFCQEAHTAHSIVLSGHMLEHLIGTHISNAYQYFICCCVISFGYSFAEDGFEAGTFQVGACLTPERIHGENKRIHMNPSAYVATLINHVYPDFTISKI